MSIPTHAADDAFETTDPAVQRVEQRMKEEGEALVETSFTDYFAEPERHTFYLPDGKQFFVFQECREGQKALYEKITNREGIKVQRSTGEAKLPIDPAIQRQTLIKVSVVDSYIVYPAAGNSGKWEELRFDSMRPASNQKFWERVFERFPASIIEDLHKAIEKVNPWLAADDDPEAIQKQIDDLEERKRRAQEEEAKKNFS
jgi:hypothetical protein